jgi:hypothetical protein
VSTLAQKVNPSSYQSDIGKYDARNVVLSSWNMDSTRSHALFATSRSALLIVIEDGVQIFRGPRYVILSYQMAQSANIADMQEKTDFLVGTGSGG